MSEKLCAVCGWPDKTIEIDGKWYCILHTPAAGGLSPAYVHQTKYIEMLESAIDSFLADVLAQGYNPDDCPDWRELDINCDSLLTLYRLRNPENEEQ